MVLQLIDRVDRWLAANRADYYACLQPGASDRELDAFEERFALRLPEAFRLFYRWRNGQDPSCGESLQENRMFSSLQEITETKVVLDGMIGHDFDDPHWWRRSWVPFLANGGGDYLCLDLSAEDGGSPGQIVEFWHDWEKRPVKYTSFDQWLQELSNAMEQGTLRFA